MLCDESSERVLPRNPHPASQAHRGKSTHPRHRFPLVHVALTSGALHHHTMSDKDQPMSDADKIRLKRLARLGAPSAPQAAASPAEEAHPEQPRPPPASSRLLNTPQASSSRKPLASSSSQPVALLRPKKPSHSPPGPAPIAQRPTQARLPIPYAEWEAQQVQAIFSVTLSVSSPSS